MEVMTTQNKLISEKLSAIDHSWQLVLQEEFNKPYMQKLRAFLKAEKDQKKIIYPKSSNVFNALNLAPFDKVKVVILGQDPYHGPNQAHGLCFSVQPQIPLPPSLKNIYKELQSDLNILPANHGCLSSWAKQGVLLLNAVLTVEQGKPNSHQGKGWEDFTDKIIQCLNKRNTTPIVFLLWGTYAQKKGELVDSSKHLILKAPHPSPLSVHKGFFGCQHFSKTNEYLIKTQQNPINWELPAKEGAKLT
ncbi:MAG: uracil-DNA glycosylase [Francisellaceae bacterium]|nr:uracil-DNA glycosylase [Francisellaceae bacterium]